MRGTSSLLFLVLSSLIFIIMIITPANALGKIEQTYVGGNDATELVRAFNAWIDENDGESWSKVLVKEFPGTFFLFISRPSLYPNQHSNTLPYSIPPRSRSERTDRSGRRLHLDSLEIGDLGGQDGGSKACKIIFQTRERLRF